MVRSLGVDADRQVLVYLLVAQAAVYVSGPYFNPYMLGQLRLDYLGYMVLTCAAMAAKVVFLPALGQLAERWGASRLLWAGGAGHRSGAGALAGERSLGLPFRSSGLFRHGLGRVRAGDAAVVLRDDPHREANGRADDLQPGQRRGHRLRLVSWGAGILAALGTNRQAYLVLFVVSALARGGALLLLVRLPRTALAPRIRPAPSRAVWSARVSEGLDQLALRCQRAQPDPGTPLHPGKGVSRLPAWCRTRRSSRSDRGSPRGNRGSW